MSEEDIIKTITGSKRNPFSTPEGYFDTLADSILSQLPDNQRKPKTVHLRPWLWAAAFAGMAIVSTTLYLNRQTDSAEAKETLLASYNDATPDSYFDDAADYAMVDNQDIYASLLADM